MASIELDGFWPALLEDMPITVALLDHERRFRYVNRVDHGFKRSDVEGIPIDGLLPDADRARITRIIDDVLQTGQPNSYETRRMTPSGFVRYLVRLSALRIDGEIRYAILMSLDITQEHEKRELAEREHALLAALESVNGILLSAPVAEPMFDRVLKQMLSLFDCERAFLCYPCDPAASEFSVIYEQTVPEFPGAKGLTLPVDDRIIERFELALKSNGAARNDPECNPIPENAGAMSAYQIRSMLFAAVRTEADRPWLLGIHHCRQARVYDAEVPLLSAIAARIGDGLQTWRTQQAMQQSEQHFRLLVEHAPDAIVIFDTATGHFIEANSKAVELFGFPREQLLQRGPVELSPELQPDGIPSAVHASKRIPATLTGQTQVFEWLHVNAAGKPIECEVRLLHLPHPERRLIRGSILDIGERKRAQRENERLSAQLAQAQKMEAIGHLTGGVAHDFNNLLTVIGGSLEIMELEARGKGNLHKYGVMALDACRRAAALTQRLLAFSRQQPLRPRAVDVGQLLQDMAGLLRRTLGETVHVEIDCRADLWLCEVDPAQLESAVLNLSINARDAMPRGGRLSIDGRNARLDEDALAHDDELVAGDYVLISVSDDGTGITPEVLDRVFEPFFTTKEVGKGSGLGLSMVYGFAKQSRGHVKIYSELDHGTTVRLFLPRSQSDTSVAPDNEPSATTPRGDGELVLLVEDDTSLRSLAVTLLQRLDYRTLAAPDAAAALELLADRADVSLLLTDMVLPGGINGAELARRAATLRPELPVLFMSGYTENAVIHNGRLDPGVNLLEKPFTTHTLATAIRKALRGGES